MSKFGRALRGVVEKVVGRFYEGPEAPPRLIEEVKLFRGYNPDAGPAEWEDYAIALAGAAYRDGFIRGLEWQQRGWTELDESDLQKQERARHNWIASRYNAAMQALIDSGGDPRDPAFGLSPEARQVYFQQVAEQVRADVVAYEQVLEQQLRRQPQQKR